MPIRRRVKLAPAGRADGQPRSAPSADLQEARAAVAALLVDIERLHPGLALHRSLDLDGGSGVRAQALCESFGECDALCPTSAAVRAANDTNRHSGRCRYLHSAGQELAGQELPFAEETFDFVHCGALRSDDEHVERVVIAEALRMLRLHGVAVVDLPGKRPARPALDDPLGAVRLLVRLPDFERARAPAGRTHEIAVTVTNAGARVLGSALAPLRLEGRWRTTGGAPGDAHEAVLDGILLPGDSWLATLPVPASSTLEAHALELSVLNGNQWGEHRSVLHTTLAICVGTPAHGELSSTADPVLPDVDRRICAAVARADGVMLGVRTLAPSTDSEPWTRYFFARA